MEEEQMTAVLRTLLDEAYGACAWLEGSITLSDRARVYKVKKLREALAGAEMCLQALEGEHSPGPLPRLP